MELLHQSLQFLPNYQLHLSAWKPLRDPFVKINSVVLSTRSILST